ncbi:MAG: XRE family transcriptional regulator [Gammaproteobacteria bacterium]|jgi:transcriptional regulator with XRE-family HTH domain|nr:XRE family transcriptional regulator [Gammaproteobacteria bacterium]MDX2460474.1 XRE family transcriptional regulator [Gammaproteobacteria bacterium]
MASKSLKKKGSRPIKAKATRRVQDATPANQLEIAIGEQVRTFRKQLHMTVAEVANQADLSPGMLSKIENGLTSPSLATLKALSGALNVPVTAFFRKYEEERDATFVKAGQGLNIERRGTRAGHQYQLLGHTVGKQVFVEPYLISLTEESDVFPLFQHDGVEFIYMLSGEVIYRHANETYRMTAGDALFFDADAPHGPEELVSLPIRFLAVIVEPRGSES